MSSRFEICATCQTEPCTCYSSWSAERIEALLNRVFAEVMRRGLWVRYEYLPDGAVSRFAGLTIGPRPTADAPRADEVDLSPPAQDTPRAGSDDKRGGQR